MTRVAINGHAYTHFGPRQVEDKVPSTFEQKQGQKVYTLTFNYDDLPTTSSDDELVLNIPANAYIEEATLRTLTAFAGGTSYTVGLSQTDGTVIDADGIFTAASLPLAAINAAGKTVKGSGALVDATAGIGANAGQITVNASGTFTAGRAQIDVVYRTLDDRVSDR